jgi:hypothetical protein
MLALWNFHHWVEPPLGDSTGRANLIGVSGKEKKINNLCDHCALEVKYLPFDLHRFEAKLR